MYTSSMGAHMMHTLLWSLIFFTGMSIKHKKDTTEH